MSDYAYVAGRVRKAQSAVEALERALVERPEDRGLLLNLQSAARLLERSRSEMNELARVNSYALCDYRLASVTGEGYALDPVSRSLLTYQELFSQVYAALKDGPKSNVGVKQEHAAESAMDFGYSYAGSLGFMFLVRDQRDLIDGRLDEPVMKTVDVAFMSGVSAIRDVANELGRAVAKRAFDWFEANVDGGFSADMKWRRSDGRMIGGVVDNLHMANLVWDYRNTIDHSEEDISVEGFLVGGDINSNRFHIVVSNDEQYQGSVSANAVLDQRTLGRRYRARIRVVTSYRYATDQQSETHTLLDLRTIDEQ